MPNTHEVALYLRSLVDYGEGDLISQLKLYKLVYYAQAWSLVFLKEPLFDGEIQAWRHGPVPVELRAEYKTYEDRAIPKPVESREDLAKPFTDEQLRVLHLVWEKYGDFTATKLYKLCHREAPWEDARGDLPLDAPSNILMPRDLIQEYYAEFAYIDNGDFFIDDEVLKENKSNKLLGTLQLKNGTSKTLEFSELIEFFDKNTENILQTTFPPFQ